MKFIRCGTADYVNVNYVARVRLLQGGDRVELTFLDGKKEVITGSDAQWTFDAVSQCLISDPAK